MRQKKSGRGKDRVIAFPGNGTSERFRIYIKRDRRVYRFPIEGADREKEERTWRGAGAKGGATGVVAATRGG